jgi:hypothetical protein
MLFRLVRDSDVPSPGPVPYFGFKSTLRRNWNLLTGLGASGEKSPWTAQIIAVTSWQNAIACCL